MPENQQDLYFMVGEIHSDVKKLLKSDADKEGRLTSLERKVWAVSGGAAVIGMFVAPAIAAAARATGLM